MTDEGLVEAFESATLDGGAFTHEAHVRVAWWYLRQLPFTEALSRFSRALQAYAAHLGASDKYHETMTVAYMAVIAERLERASSDDWQAFRDANTDLLTRQPSILSRYYTDARLQSPLAKRTFVLPDRPSARGKTA